MASFKYPATSGRSPYWGDSVATEASLPATGTLGELRFVRDVKDVYFWTGSAWERATENTADVTGPASSTDHAVARFDSTTGKILLNSAVTIDDSGNVATAGTIDGRDVSTDGAALDQAELDIVTAQAAADAAQGDATQALADAATAQSTADAKVAKAGDTMSGALLADGGVDVTATGGTDTLNLGVTNADVINIGRSGSQINMVGTTAFQQIDNYEVADKNITVNKGGAAASATSAGVEVEEDSSITAYVRTSVDRNSWQLKAPNAAGAATIAPGASGITLDQSSHNPVTIGTANGLSLATQALSLAAAASGVTGALTATDWAAFTAKLTIDSVAAVSGDVTLTDRRLHLVDTSSARSLTLPAPAATRYIVVKDKTGSASTNPITLVRAAGENIETVAASYVLDSDLGSWTLVSDGTDWFII